MSKLRPVNQVYGTRLRAPGCHHEYVLLKEWMLKPLWLQYALGIPMPKHKLPGVVSNYCTGEEPGITSRICVDFFTSAHLYLEYIGEPGCDYQLLIVRRTNGN